jgi:hypothetical protein
MSINSSMLKIKLALKPMNKELGSLVLKYRYLICLAVTFIICCIGFALAYKAHWPAKDILQVCTGFLLVITLYFTALNYEFTASKTRNDYKTAKEILTFNTANEWHKTPIKDYQRTSIEHENKFIARQGKRTIIDLDTYIDETIDYRESIKGILNYFENMSVGVYKGLIDKELVFEFISYIFEIYYIDYYYYIENYRKKRNNNGIWRNFTKLAEEWWPSLKEEILNGTKKSSIVTHKN